MRRYLPGDAAGTGEGLGVNDGVGWGDSIGVRDSLGPGDAVGLGFELGDGVGVGVAVVVGVGDGVGKIQLIGSRAQISVALCPARASVILPAATNPLVEGSKISALASGL